MSALCTKGDSTYVVKIVNDFYDWYITAIKEKRYTDFQPRFVKAENGMTTLDYSMYVRDLKNLKFSDSLIIKEKSSYKECIDNLAKVSYADFGHTKFTDLDEFEETKCDFANYYRWLGGMDQVDGIRIKSLEFISKDIVVVLIDYFEIDSKENTKYFWGKNILILKRFKSGWYIDKIQSWNSM
ncbi:MAG: hypothetical protein JXB49_23670 [Bacteroidales bacterium]|nr:hypothetical protein [Bacteroidales bacterium]